MTMLDKITKGKIERPKIVLVFGADGVGKSTFAAQAPNPIFIGAEDGTAHLDVSRFPSPKTFGDVLSYISALKNEKHQYKTLVIDSLDWLEPLLHREICKEYSVSSIEKAAGGYGKGYVEAVNKWQEFVKHCSELRDEAGMNIIFIAHAEIVKFSDPMEQTEYDRYTLKLYKKTAALFREFCDAVLFANFEIFTKKDGTRTRAYGDGVRVAHTERRPGFDAKNRFNLKPTLPLDWNEFIKACSEERVVNADELREQILEMLKEAPEELRKKVTDATEKAGKDTVKLDAIKSKLLIRLGE